MEDAPSPPEPSPPKVGGIAHVVVSAVLIVVFLAVGAFAFLMLKGMKEEPQKGATSPIRTSVRVLALERGTHTEVISGYGRVRALEMARVPAEVAGTVIWLREGLEAGASVTANEELVRLDDRDAKNRLAVLEARRRQAEASRVRARVDQDGLVAQIREAETELAAAERELDRIRGMVPHAASKSDVDRQRIAVSARRQILAALETRSGTAGADVTRADADIAAAGADLAQAQLDLERTTIRAPFAGVIEMRHARIGERVTPGTTLVDLVDLSRIEVPVELPASRHADVEPGVAATLNVPGREDLRWSGDIARVDPSVDPETRTFAAYIEITSAGETRVPAPGSFVTATVTGRSTPDCFAVPREAFVGDVVYVARMDGEEAVIEERRPTILRRLADVALVREGLAKGELVVITNVEQVADGSRVRVVRQADALR